MSSQPPHALLEVRNLQVSFGGQAVVHGVDFDIVRGEQRYARTAKNVYRYESGTYAADIAIDDAGLVTDYDEWRRIGATRSR